jgi:hypothetical protein
MNSGFLLYSFRDSPQIVHSLVDYLWTIPEQSIEG